MISTTRPPNVLADYVPTLRASNDEFRLRLLLHDFGLVWQDSSLEERIALIAPEPELFDPCWDAFLAAYAEHLARSAAMAPPSWTSAGHRFLSNFWYAGGCYAFDRTRTIITTPGAFEEHGVWLPRSELTVV